MSLPEDFHSWFGSTGIVIDHRSNIDLLMVEATVKGPYRTGLEEQHASIKRHFQHQKSKAEQKHEARQKHERYVALMKKAYLALQAKVGGSFLKDVPETELEAAFWAELEAKPMNVPKPPRVRTSKPRLSGASDNTPHAKNPRSGRPTTDAEVALIRHLATVEKWSTQEIRKYLKRDRHWVECVIKGERRNDVPLTLKPVEEELAAALAYRGSLAD